MSKILILSVLVIAGCSRYDSNLFECKMEAAKAPTGTGVQVAYRACLDKFSPNEK
jgi:hypothetical protein